MSKTIIESSGNVFADLGFSPEEATLLSLRSSLMNELRQILQEKKLDTTTSRHRAWGKPSAYF
jgi:predicted XRE-type DNA-binding protein